jgi:hypothetical protein
MPGSSSWMPYAPQGVKGFDIILSLVMTKYVGIYRLYTKEWYGFKS